MQFIQAEHDRWHRRESAETSAPHLLPYAHALLTLTQWQAVRDHWPAQFAVGVILPNDADVGALAGDLHRLSLVALQFPKWTDGRAYSQARLLRVRHRFGGELRATGAVLVDMLPLLRRCGFDSVALRADQDLDTAREALGFFAGHYQGDTVQPQPIFQREAA